MTLIERFARALVSRRLPHARPLRVTIDRSPSFRAVVLNGMVVYQHCVPGR
jgi:hypothetical protein